MKRSSKSNRSGFSSINGGDKKAITISSFTVDLSCNLEAQAIGIKQGRYAERNQERITYWAVYLDDKHISYTSNKESAEKTKVWMEKWLSNSCHSREGDKK